MSRQINLIIGLTIVLIGVVLVRLPFFFYYPLPIVGPDSYGYYTEIANLEAELWPSFGLRTPGYILLVWFIRKITHDALFVVFVQVAITTLTAIGIPIVMATYQPRLVLPLSLALVVYFTAPMFVLWDIALLTDGVYVCAMMWALTGLYIGIANRHRHYAVLGSFMAGWAIYVRPNGAFLIVVFLLAAGWALWRYRNLWLPFALLAPLLAMLGGLFFYNSRSTGITGFSCLQESKLTAWSSVSVDPDPSFPAAVNAALETRNRLISPNDRDVVFNSWDLYAFSRAFNNIADIAHPALRTAMGADDPDCAKSFVNSAAVQNQINKIGLQQHPLIYVKFFLSIARDYLLATGSTIWGDLYSWVPAMQYRDTFVEKTPTVARLQSLGDFYQPAQPIGYSFYQDKAGITQVKAPESGLTAIAIAYFQVRDALFQRFRWTAVYALAILIGLFVFVRSRGRSAHAFVGLLLVMCVIGNLIICAFGVSHADKRYVYSTEFVMYALMACVPLLWPRGRRG